MFLAEVLLTTKPKIIAITINKMLTIATVEFDVDLTKSTAPVSVNVALNVFATIEANAATTRINVR